MPKPSPQRVQLRHICVDFHNHRIHRGSEQQDIDGQTLRVLKVLIDHYPHTVAREQLLEEAWPNLVVGDNSLSQCITHLRRLWEDNPKDPSFIRTVPRRGYQLLVKPEPLILTEKPRHRWSRPAGLALIAASLVWVVVVAVNEFTDKPAVPWPYDVFLPTHYVTTQPGIESFQRFSPDGHRLAYAQAGPEGDYDLAVTRLHNSRHRVLLEGAGDTYPGDWSPGGRYLLAIRQHEGDCELVVLDPQRPEQAGYHLFACEYSDFPPRVRWVADDQLYMAHSVAGEPRLTRLTLTRLPESTSYQVAETHVMAGVYPEDLDSSPDEGRYLLLSERREAEGHYRLVRFDTQTGAIDELDTQLSPYWGISWFGDATRYLMGGRLRAGQEHGEVQDLYPHTSVILDVDYHPSGKIAISEARAKINLALVEPGTGLADSKDDLPLLAPSSQVDFLPALSADGRQLAFVSSRHSPSQLGLWYMTYPDGEPELLQKLDSDILPQRLRWSGNGRYLMMSDNRHRIYCYDTQQASWQRVTAPEEQAFYPFWVENSLHFNVISKEQIRLVAMQACGGSRRIIATLDNYALHRFDDGSLLLGDPDTGEISHQKERITSTPIARVESLDTLYAGERGLYYFRKRDKYSTLVFKAHQQAGEKPLFRAITANYGNVSRQFAVWEGAGTLVVPMPGEHQADIIVLEAASRTDH